MVVRTTPATVIYNGRPETRVRKVTSADAGLELPICVIPAHSIIIDAGIVVTTAFTHATNKQVDMGPSTDPNGIAHALSVATAGIIAADGLAANDDSGPFAVDTTFLITMDLTGTAGDGVGYAWVTYVPLVAS